MNNPLKTAELTFLAVTAKSTVAGHAFRVEACCFVRLRKIGPHGGLVPLLEAEVLQGGWLCKVRKVQLVTTCLQQY